VARAKLQVCVYANGAAGVDLLFECPGCGSRHRIRLTGPGPNWTFDGDVNLPTISPSIRAQWDEGEARTAHVCHSHVRKGRIEYLTDSTHVLSGKTVDLPELPLHEAH
jgi:hypothetical protein